MTVDDFLVHWTAKAHTLTDRQTDRHAGVRQADDLLSLFG